MQLCNLQLCIRCFKFCCSISSSSTYPPRMQLVQSNLCRGCRNLNKKKDQPDYRIDPIYPRSLSKENHPSFLVDHLSPLHYPTLSKAVSQLMETVVRALGPSQASLLRLFLLLESREQGAGGSPAGVILLGGFLRRCGEWGRKHIGVKAKIERL